MWRSCLDILVVNAARQKFFPPFDELTSDDFDSAMRTNLYALFWTTQEAAKIMPPGASIITTASVHAYDPTSTIMHYATTKASKVENFGGGSAFGRPGQPVELAPVHVLLASQEGSYITGEVYGVTDGSGIA